MRLPSPSNHLQPGIRSRARAAFTLAEMLVAVTVFIILTAGVIAVNVYGLKMYQITATKLNATRNVRVALGRMTDDIRSASTIFVGNLNTNGVFVGKLDGEAQIGRALYLQPTTNASVYTVYFMNTNDWTLRRTTSAGVTTLLSRQVATNYNTTNIFSMQDSKGNTLTNNANNRTVHFGIRLYQPKKFGTAGDYFQVETSATRRAL